MEAKAETIRCDAEFPEQARFGNNEINFLKHQMRSNSCMHTVLRRPSSRKRNHISGTRRRGLRGGVPHTTFTMQIAYLFTSRSFQDNKQHLPALVYLALSRFSIVFLKGWVGGLLSNLVLLQGTRCGIEAKLDRNWHLLFLFTRLNGTRRRPDSTNWCKE